MRNSGGGSTNMKQHKHILLTLTITLTLLAGCAVAPKPSPIGSAPPVGVIAVTNNPNQSPLVLSNKIALDIGAGRLRIVDAPPAPPPPMRKGVAVFGQPPPFIGQTFSLALARTNSGFITKMTNGAPIVLEQDKSFSYYPIKALPPKPMVPRGRTKSVLPAGLVIDSGFYYEWDALTRIFFLDVYNLRAGRHYELQVAPSLKKKVPVSESVSAFDGFTTKVAIDWTSNDPTAYWRVGYIVSRQLPEEDYNRVYLTPIAP